MSRHYCPDSIVRSRKARPETVGATGRDWQGLMPDRSHRGPEAVGSAVKSGAALVTYRDDSLRSSSAL